VTLSAGAVKQAAREIGFLACGIAGLEESARGGALDAWLAAGYGGDMRYLHRQARKRKRPAEIVPGARTAVVVLENYLPPPRAAVGAPSRAPKIAKYARGADYHRSMLARLERLAEVLRGGGAGVARTFVDAGPVPERELAERAGLGWIGKNTMLLRPGAGSFFLIGTVLTDLDLPPDRPLDLDRCGSCTRCLEACPTDAFVGPRVLDATRCLSYLTIEQKGPLPGWAVERMEGWAFGCDICNDVCPWNEKFATPTPLADYGEREAPDRADPAYFDAMDEAAFAARFGDTPLERPGLAGMRRNWRAAFRRLGGPT
jgi:epoxyqueuosine reductase